jgi:hypothetical protein
MNHDAVEVGQDQEEELTHLKQIGDEGLNQHSGNQVSRCALGRVEDQGSSTPIRTRVGCYSAEVEEAQAFDLLVW